MAERSSPVNASRRKYLKAAAIGGTVGLAGCVGSGDEGSKNVSDLEGTKISIATTNTLQPPIETHLSKVEEEYGIEYELTPLANSQILPKMMNQFRAQNSEFDMFTSDVMWTGSFMEPEFVEQIDGYLDNEELLIDGYDYDDHLDIYANNYGKWNGKTFGLPIHGDMMKMVVRKDLLEEYADEYREEHGEDIMMPYLDGYESYEKYNRVAEFMSERGLPIGLEAKRGWNIVYTYPNRFAAATGEQSMIADGESKLDLSGAEKGLENYIKEIEWAKNPNSTAFTESMSQFMSGEIWALETWSVAVSEFSSKYTWEEDMRVGLTPGGYPCLGGYGLLINSFSDQIKKDAAFVAGQHLTSKAVDKEMYKSAGIGSTRSSSYTDELKDAVPQARYADPEENPGIKSLSLRPNTPNYAKLADTMSAKFSEAFSNYEQADAAQVIQDVHSEWKETLDN